MKTERLKKYREERDKNAAKIAELQDRNKKLEQKILEAENLEIRSLMESQSMTADDLARLLHSLRDKPVAPRPVTPYSTQKLEDTDDEEA